MGWIPRLVRLPDVEGRPVVRLGHRLADDYLEFLAARARPNTVLAYAFDLKVFFGVVGKEPVEVTSGDVLAFISDQRAAEGNVVRIADGESGLSARTIHRRLSAVSGFYGYLMATGDVAENRADRCWPRLRRDSSRAPRGHRS